MLAGYNKHLHWVENFFYKIKSLALISLPFSLPSLIFNFFLSSFSFSFFFFSLSLSLSLFLSLSFFKCCYGVYFLSLSLSLSLSLWVCNEFISVRFDRNSHLGGDNPIGIIEIQHSPIQRSLSPSLGSSARTPTHREK